MTEITKNKNTNSEIDEDGADFYRKINAEEDANKVGLAEKTSENKQDFI